MKTWTRLTLAGHCGSCGKPIADGSPVLEISCAGLKRPFVRCPGCAGEPVDEERLAIQDEAQEAERPKFEFTGATRDLFGEAGE